MPQALLILEFAQFFLGLTNRIQLFPTILSHVLSIIGTLSGYAHAHAHARVLVLIGNTQTQVSMVATMIPARREWLEAVVK
jgi:hypothetical protein